MVSGFKLKYISFPFFYSHDHFERWCATGLYVKDSDLVHERPLSISEEKAKAFVFFSL